MAMFQNILDLQLSTQMGIQYDIRYLFSILTVWFFISFSYDNRAYLSEGSIKITSSQGLVVEVSEVQV